MRILFICSQTTDYLQDLTYAGLAETLGRGSVVDLPHRWAFRDSRRFFWSRSLEYPKNLGLVADGDGPISYSEPAIRRSLQSNGFDVVFLASAKPDALQVFNRLFENIRVPWVFVDGGDRAEIGGDFRREGGDASWEMFRSLCRKKSPALVFKRELAPESRSGFVFPLPFSVNPSKIGVWDPDAAKKYQVLFWAVESSETRRQAFRLLRGRYDCDRNGSTPGQTFRKYAFRGEKYFRALNEAAVVLSFRGEGFDTLRYWEVPACGSLLLSERPLIRIPDDFADGRQAVYCKNDLSDLLDKIDYFLKNGKEALDIARAGQKHVLGRHTHRRRAEYILGVLNEKLGLKAD